MKYYTIYKKLDPTRPYYTIKEDYEYTLIIDDENNNIFVNYKTDINIPCSAIRMNSDNFIDKTFTLEEFFNIKQGKKYKCIVKAKKLVVAKLVELISNKEK